MVVPLRTTEFVAFIVSIKALPAVRKVVKKLFDVMLFAVRLVTVVVASVVVP